MAKNSNIHTRTAMYQIIAQVTVEDGNSTSFSSWISYLFLSVMEIYSFYLPEYFPNFPLLIYDRRSILLVQFLLWQVCLCNHHIFATESKGVSSLTPIGL